MDRIRNLDRYQKFILLVLSVMAVCFTVAYIIVSSRVGFAYRGEILLPSRENGMTVYSGVIDGQLCSFTVTDDKTVLFRCSEKIYGPYTAKEDPSAIPEDHAMSEYMTGVEIRQNERVFYRGGVYASGNRPSDWMLFDEDGGFSGFTITAEMSDGSVVTVAGKPLDKMAPSASTILELMSGPELTAKAEWNAWLLGLLTSAATLVSILFADELFRWNLAFRIRDAERAEPSDWDLAGRYLGWTLLPIMAFIIYLTGLN